MTQVDALRQLEEFQPALLRAALTNHPEWVDFSSAFGNAAPQKLILTETIAYVEQMIEVAGQFRGLDDAMQGLEDLRQALQDVDEDSPLDDDGDEAGSLDDERSEAETNYVENVRNSTHYLIEIVQDAQDDLAIDDEEREELDDDTRKALDALEDALSKTMKLVEMNRPGICGGSNL